ncbi:MULTISPECIES: hypothetical protein [unclassified Streptomyces]|uniref:hypothetical protein n=1 Tax=unclassified Streptomyces TaxID=2593676 RepID=UPI0035D6C725
MNTAVRMRQLGRTGIEVSAYCLGATMFGPKGSPGDGDGAQIVQHRCDLDAAALWFTLI